MTDPSLATQPLDPNELLRRGQQRASLWWQGRLPDPARPRVAVVGSRKASAEQLRVATELAAALGQAGAVVVSGGAVGIDTAALQGALAAAGPAIAVLPGALDRPFPAENAALFAQVAASGGLLTAVAPGTVAGRGAFLPRNHLLVQVVDAVIAVCADAHSGSLHCAGQAWDAGLPVLTVPWTPRAANSAGSNALLAAGARAVYDAAGCAALVADLAAGRAELWLRRSPRPPGRGLRRPPRTAEGSPAEPAGGEQSIDVGYGERPCYEAVAVTSIAALHDRGGRETAPATAADPLLIEGLGAALRAAGPAGLSLEELAHALGVDRARLATLALDLVLRGRLRRRGGVYAWPGPGG